MKVILILYLCSMTTGACLPPYQYPTEFNDMYECLNTGYSEALKKSKEIGKKEVNENEIFIRFICKKETKVKVET
jgi:hypothetical protein